MDSTGLCAEEICEVASDLVILDIDWFDGLQVFTSVLGAVDAVSFAFLAAAASTLR